MLDDLRELHPEKVAQINEGAIAYYAQYDDPVSRAEEIYHRLQAGQAAEEIDPRWSDEAAPYLASALEELAPEQRLYLSPRLGIEPDSVLAEAASLMEWERFTEKGARARLREDDLQGALQILGQRQERSAASPLYLTEAEVLVALGRRDDALGVIARGLDSASQAGARRRTAELLVLRAVVHEGQGDFAGASFDLATVLEIARALDDRLLTTRAVVGLLRQRRKTADPEGPDAAELVALIAEMTGGEVPYWLREYPGLFRELAAELGPLWPDLVAATVIETGPVRPRTDQPALGTLLVEALGEQGARDLLSSLDGFEGFMAGSPAQQADQLPRIVSVARRRGQMDDLAVPLAALLAAEIDAAIGATPSPAARPLEPWWQSETMSQHEGVGMAFTH